MAKPYRLAPRSRTDSVEPHTEVRGIRPTTTRSGASGSRRVTQPN